MIPLFDLKAQQESIKPEIDKAVDRVLSSGQYINGREVEALENEISIYLNIKHTIGVASGTDALIIALRALDIGPGDEVIVPAFSFWSTASAVLLVGATPVFVDVSRKDWNINCNHIEKKITTKTKAIIPVHLYGNPANIPEIQQIIEKRKIAIIEDAAQAFGARINDNYVGTLGTIGCFSFFPTKPLGASGDGGMLVTHDSTLARKIRQLKSHGWVKKYDPQVLGYNSRLDALQAAILRVKLPHVKEWINQRLQKALWYNTKFNEWLFAIPLHQSVDENSAQHLYMLNILNRDRIADFLKDHGIEAGIYYPIPLYRCKPASYKVNNEYFLTADMASACNLAIPCHENLDMEDSQFIVNTILEAAFYANQSK